MRRFLRWTCRIMFGAAFGYLAGFWLVWHLPMADLRAAFPEIPAAEADRDFPVTLPDGRKRIMTVGPVWEHLSPTQRGIWLTNVAKDVLQAN